MEKIYNNNYKLRKTSITMDYDNLNKSDIERQELKQKILKDVELCKCLMILAIKKYTWRNELIVNFGITKHKADKFKEILNDLGYIAHKLIWEIPDDIAYFVMKSQANMIDQAQIMCLTPAGEEWAKSAMTFIAKQTNSNESLQFALNYVIERTKSFKKKYKEIETLEYAKSKRLVIHHLGNGKQVIEERETLLGKEIKENLKIVKAEMKLLNLDSEKKIKTLEKIGIKENLLLPNPGENGLIILKKGGTLIITYSQALTILGEKSDSEKMQDIANGPKIVYSGCYSHLTGRELENLSQGVSDDEYREELKKGYIGVVNYEENTKTNKELKGLSCRGYHDEESEHIGKIEDKPSNIMDFLGIDQ